MNLLHDLHKNLSVLEEKIGYVFVDKSLLVQALVHRSFLNEHKNEVQGHNERLEFLGDSVLGLLMADFLYHRLPQDREGPLSQLRSRLVDGQACAHYLQTLELQQFLMLGRGEFLTDGKTKTSILSDAFEALIGAMYLDGGLNVVKTFLSTYFGQDIEDAIGSPSRNYKAELQVYAQKKFQKAPLYKVVEESGPDHAKMFCIAVYVDMKEAGMGKGESKKQAEQQAAFDALSKLKEV